MKSIVLVTDIFGQGESVEGLAKWLSTLNYDVVLCDPYSAKVHTFDDEAHAYRHFIAACGHELYAKKLAKLVSQVSPEAIIGFSAGASAAWRLAGSDLACENILCFYPSQIAKFKHLIPQVNTHLVLPCREPHFDVLDVVNHLHVQQLSNLTVTVSEFEHGFMNPQVPAYQLAAETFGKQVMTDWIATLKASEQK